MMELGIEYVVIGVMDKVVVFGQLLDELDLNASEVAVMGDDLLDLFVFKLCGYFMVVEDVVDEIWEIVVFVTIVLGGRGVVCEVIEYLFKVKGFWNEVLKYFGVG